MSCNYTLTDLKDEIYLIDDESTVQYKVSNIEVSSESSLNNRYAFHKEISFTLPGYNRLPVTNKQIAFALKSGEIFLFNQEFTFTEHYVFTYSEQENRTQYQLEIDENLDFIPYEISSYEDAESSSTCGYSVPGKPQLEVVKFHEAVLDEENETLLTGSTPIQLDGVVTFREEYDGNLYQKTVTCNMPLDSDNQELNNTLKEFQFNKYIAIVNGQDLHFISGLELGMVVNSTISTDENGSRIELNFTVDENLPVYVTENLAYDEMETVVYRPVMYSHLGDKGYTCVSDGQAGYVLQRGFLYDGTATDMYRCLRGKEDNFPYLNITGTFRQIYPFDCDECVISDELNVGLPSQLSFSGSGQTINFTVSSEVSSWSATSVPSFITLSATSGTSGTTSLTLTCTGTSTDSGLLRFVNAKNRTDVSVNLIQPELYVTPSNIDAHARDVYVYANSNGFSFDHAEVRVGMLGTQLGVVVTQFTATKWRVTLPKNPNSSSNRVIVLFFTRDQETQTVEITQNQLFVGFRSLYTVCVDGELQSVEEKYESYDEGSTWQTTGEMRRIVIGTC